MKIVIGILLFLFLAGCTTVPEFPVEPVEPTPPDINLTDLNLFVNPDPVPLADTNSISIDLNINRITLNFEFDLNSPDIDLNVISNACDLVCSGYEGNFSWKLSKDINFGTYYCTCTVCKEDRETTEIIYKYCSDHKFDFAVSVEKDE